MTTAAPQRPIILWILGGLIVFVLIWAAWQWQTQGPDQGAVTFETAELDRGPIVQSVTASGQVEAVITVEVGSQLSGQIAEIYVDFNDTVKKDQLLALLDPQTFQTRVASGEADLAVAQANVTVQEANVRKARSVLEQSRRELERQRALADRGNVSQTVLENAQTAVTVAEADLAIAEAQVENARSVVLQRAATLEQARIDLERTEIRSPIDGVVINRAVDAGQTVAASLQAPILFEIAQDLARIQIAAEVNEADVGGIGQGNPVSFTVDAFADRQFRGTVRQVRLAATELQNVVTYTVIVEANNPGQRLFPGMTATTEIITGQREDVLRAPAAALRFVPPGIDRSASRRPGQSFGLTLRALAAELDFTSEQQAKIEEALAQARQRFQSRRGGNGGPPQAGGGQGPRGQGAGRQGAGRPGGGQRFDPAAMRAFLWRRVDRLLEDVLTAEQKTRYQTLRDRLEETAPALLWSLDASGEPQGHPIMLGLNDGAYGEIVAGGLGEGDTVIVRAGGGRGR